MKKFKYKFIHMDPFKDKYAQNQAFEEEDFESKKDQSPKLSMKELNRLIQEQQKNKDG